MENKIKILILLPFLFGTVEISWAKDNKPYTNVLSSNNIVDTCITPDSLYSASDAKNKDTKIHSDSFYRDSGYVSIIVHPIEASDAEITIIQKSKIEIEPNVVTTYEIGPDTIMKGQAPLSLRLSLGDYDLILIKDGFKNKFKRVVFNKTQDSITIEMTSLLYLQTKREEWASYKWISSAVAVGTSVVSFLLKHRISTLNNEYNDAILPRDIQNKRNSISANQNYYKISSGIAISAIGGFVISWVVEQSF